MKIFGVDTTTRPALIAEIGVNHEGSLEKAVELLHLAAEAGADAVKFQSYTPNRFISSEDPERLARVTRFGLDEEAHLILKNEADKAGVAFFSSAITENWVPFLAQQCEAIKIASGDIDFEPVIRSAAASGVAVILSTGTADLSEVERAVSWALESGVSSDHLALLHCVSAYPTPLDQANLTAIQTLADIFPSLCIGYSNHVIGPEACLAAVALGAEIVEVHFTDNKHGRSFRDHELSCDPRDLAYLVQTLPQVAAARGSGVKHAQPCEDGMGPAIRKGLIVSRDLAAGHVLTSEDLHFARPASEIPSGRIADVIGRPLAEAVTEGQVLKRSAVVGLE